MPIYFTEDHKPVIYYGQESIIKYRPDISAALIKTFGTGPFSTPDVTRALFFCIDWYSHKLLELLKAENSLTFFQGLFILHEFSCELQRSHPNRSPIPEISDTDFSMYRRVLKLCLEQGCDIPLTDGPQVTPSYITTKLGTIEDLLYLGDFIYAFSNLLSEQHMIEDCVDLRFTEDDLFYFDHKHHYGYIIGEIVQDIPDHLTKAVVDKKSFSDFSNALKSCLGVDYNKAITTIQAIHEHFKDRGGKLVLDDWEIYPNNLEQLFDIPITKGRIFYKGLTLDKKNKLPITDVVYRPHKLNRYLYRPFLIWNVDGRDLTIVGDGIFIESIGSLLTNAFAWGKFPPEWGNDCFVRFIQSQEDKNDRILEDAVEELLKDRSILFDRNIKSLSKWSKQNIRLDNSECGEIDFIFVYDNKIFITECKHQAARYDMNNFKNDYSYFETGKKPYNKTLARKVDFLSKKIEDIEEHFQVALNSRSFKLPKGNLEGIFVVNTPTFIMYNNQFRIYTMKSFEDLISGEFIDATYSFFIEGEDEDSIISVTYPYFIKPDYKVFKDIDEE